MQFSGLIKMNATPAQLRAALVDPVVLTAMLPGKAKVTQTGPDAYDFSLSMNAGVINLTLKGTILIEGSDSDAPKLVLQGKHLVGGSANLTAALTLVQGKHALRVGYDADLVMGGMAKRLVGDRKDRVRQQIVKILERLKTQVEAVPNV